MIDKILNIYYTISYTCCAIFLCFEVIMANLVVHIAIAQEWAKKNKVNNFDDFVWGAVAPDIIGIMNHNSVITHYGNVVKGDDILEHWANKVNINKFLDNNDINNDYMLGYLLHLVVDYYFYNEFLKRNMILNMCSSVKELKQYLYQAYDSTTQYVNNEFNISYNYKNPLMKDIKSKYGNNNLDEKPILYSYDELKDFITKMSEFNLQELITTRKMRRLFNTSLSEGKDNYVR